MTISPIPSAGKRTLSALLALTFCLALFAGCAKEDVSRTDAQTNTVSYNGETYTVPKDPQRIVTLSTSVLQLLYAVDGKAIARVDTREPLSDELAALPIIGHTDTPTAEKILELKPDLVLGLSIQHGKMKDVFASNHIPFIPVNFEGIYNTTPILTFFGELTGHQEKAARVVADYDRRVAAVKEKAASLPPLRVAVLRATGKSVTAETPLAITASMVKELGFINVATQELTSPPTTKTIPYSLEALAAADPDVIFIVTMGKAEDITKTMQAEMTDNPAWNGLTAVSSGKVIYLPSRHYLLNPALETPEAMAALIDYAYAKP